MPPKLDVGRMSAVPEEAVEVVVVDAAREHVHESAMDGAAERALAWSASNVRVRVGGPCVGVVSMSRAGERRESVGFSVIEEEVGEVGGRSKEE